MNRVATAFFLALVLNNALFIIIVEYKNTSSLMDITNNPMCPTKYTMSDEFKTIGKFLYKAYQHVHDTKPKTYLKSAINVLETTLNKLGQDYTFSRQSLKSKNTCPEVYVYGEAFKVTDCKTNSSLESIVTMILYHDSYDFESVESLFASLYKIGNKIKVIMPLYFPNQDYNYLETRYSFLKIIPFGEVSKGECLNTLLWFVETEYVFFGNNIQFFNTDARLDRLVHEIESINVTVAGGAVRNNHGHWDLGCHQTDYKNYTLFYKSGYDESFHECVFCDFIVGPFLIRTNIAIHISFDEHLPSVGLFEDFFIRLTSLGYESVICSDVMFHVTDKASFRNEHTQNWQPFANKYQLYRLVFGDGLDFNFECPENLICPHLTSFINSPCCSLELSTLVKDTMESCDDLDDIDCEIGDGTNLGAVKLGRILPWDFDGDIYYSNQTESVIEIDLKSKLERKGYALRKASENYYVISSKNWFIDFCWRRLTTEALRKQGIKQTKVNFDGTWIGAPQNPGLVARNRYGHKIFKHAEHWRFLGYKDGFVPYHSGTFQPCEIPGKHDCMDLYHADGNIQFKKTFP